MIDLETYHKIYMPAVMMSLKRLIAIEEATIRAGISSYHHTQILDLKNNIDALAQAKMLLNEYPACDICHETDCTSDHK